MCAMIKMQEREASAYMSQRAACPTEKEAIEDEIQAKKDFLDLLEEKRARDCFSPNFDAELECTSAIQRELEGLEQKLEAMNATCPVDFRSSFN